MKKHLVNAAFGVMDYASYPLGMLLVAPIVLHKLGASQYGVWMIATAVVSAGGIIASGFGDANIQRVALYRGTDAAAAIVKTVRSILGINIVSGFVLAIGVWVAAPYAAQRIAFSHLASLRECLVSLRIAGGLILVRAVESAGVSTQRAFEQYRGTVQISVVMRLLTLAVAALLTLAGGRVVSILAATAVFLVLGTGLQFHRVQKILGCSLHPVFYGDETRALLRSGIFSWIQALGGVIFGQLDRIMLGISMGALAVAPYSLCVQFAQPVAGITASSLHFLFPYLSGRAGTATNAAMRRTLMKAFICNLVLVLCGAALLLAFGNRLIGIWAGPAVAHSAAPILPLIVASSSLMGLSVTAIYALQALGRFRTVAYISLGARIAMLMVMMYLLHRFGLKGLAAARVLYCFITLWLYVPLWRRLSDGVKKKPGLACMPIIYEAQKGAEP